MTDSARAVAALDAIIRLSAIVEERPGVEVRENSSIFVQLRLALHYSASVARVFWPSDRPARERGLHMIELTGLPTECPVDRRLRNHVEHLDERLDDWTAVTPRPFTALEWVIHNNWPTGAARDSIIESVAIVYEADRNMVTLFGDTFDLSILRAVMVTIKDAANRALRRSA